VKKLQIYWWKNNSYGSQNWYILLICNQNAFYWYSKWLYCQNWKIENGINRKNFSKPNWEYVDRTRNYLNILPGFSISKSDMGSQIVWNGKLWPTAKAILHYSLANSHTPMMGELRHQGGPLSQAPTEAVWELWIF
jgi:hypothetical protein